MLNSNLGKGNEQNTQWSFFFFPLKRFIIFILCVWMLWLHVFVYHMHAVPVKARRGQQIHPGNGVTDLLATMSPNC